MGYDVIKPPLPALRTTLGGNYYVSDDIFAAEQERIFENMWFCAVRSSDLECPPSIMAREGQSDGHHLRMWRPLNRSSSTTSVLTGIPTASNVPCAAPSRYDSI